MAGCQFDGERGEHVNFTIDQKLAYRTRGFVLGPKVLTDKQIELLKNRIDDIVEDRVEFPSLFKGVASSSISSRAGSHGASSGDEAPGRIVAKPVKIVNLFRHDDVFARVWDNPAIGSLANDLMAGPVRLWEDQMIYKPPFDPQAVLGWHRDYTFWDHVAPADIGTCWIALDDATEQNGCMCVIPQSHTWELPFCREDMDTQDPDWLLKRPEIPPGADLTPVSCPVPAGHCHFHHCMLFHGSYGNATDNARRSYILHLMPGHTRRVGDDWSERMASVEHVPLGCVVQGPSYPELPPASA